ncbi:MAG: glycosyltransferase family 9 protein [Ignavibacteriaceae bacterium]|nr:glycosyltransferase family 9 protein [Ignavibacteriaceae bacterium]
MAGNTILNKLIYDFFRKYEVPEIKDNYDLGSPSRFIVIRQHNQLGDLLACVPLFRAIKEKYPHAHITAITSPSNYRGLLKNKYIDRLFIFDKKKLLNPGYFNSLHKLLSEKYDVAIVPVTISISFTSNILARFANAKIRIGPRSLDGKENKSAFFFDRRITIDWRKFPDQNMYERSLDLVKPFGITTSNLKPGISFDEEDIKVADEFISASVNLNKGEYLIGLHISAGKPQNRWSLNKFASLISRLDNSYKCKIYITGWISDQEEISFMKANLKTPVSYFLNHTITQTAALISKSDLFISNDTGIMHVAASTDVPQISLFGHTNPFLWAPGGTDKRFIRKSDFIDDITVEDVFEDCEILLRKIPAYH